AGNQRCDTRSLQGGANGEKFVPCSRCSNAPLVELGGVVPHHIGAMDIHGYAIDAAFIGEQVNQAFGEYIEPALFFKQGGQVFHTISHYPSPDQFLTSMNLEGIWRITAQHTGFQNSTRSEEHTS